MTAPKEVRRLVEESRGRFHSVLEVASEGDRLSRTFFPFTPHSSLVTDHRFPPSRPLRAAPRRRRLHRR